MRQGATPNFEYFPTHFQSLAFIILQNISPFLVPIIVISIVYYVYTVHDRSNYNQITTILNTGPLII